MVTEANDNNSPLDQSLKIYDRPSPYFTNKTIKHKYIVIHCIGYKDPLTVLADNHVSAHYVVPEQDSINGLFAYQLVNPNLRAWHAGKSQWGNDSGLNDYSIGIEVSMPNYAHAMDAHHLDFLYFESFQAAEIVALQLLVNQLQAKYNINAINVIGHSDVAPWRKNSSNEIILAKTDPGPTLPWKALSRYGIGIWPKGLNACWSDNNASNENMTAALAQSYLREIGYNVPDTGEFDAETNMTIGAARMHWQPDCFNDSDGDASSCYTNSYDPATACMLRTRAQSEVGAEPLAAVGTLAALLAVSISGGIILLTLIVACCYKHYREKNPKAYQSMEGKSPGCC